MKVITSNNYKNRVKISDNNDADEFTNPFYPRNKKQDFLKDYRIRMQISNMRDTYKYLYDGIDSIEYGLMDLFYLDKTVKEVAAELRIKLEDAWKYLSENNRIKDVVEQSQRLQNICHQVPKIS